jgi:hypothetical protein
VPEIRVHRVELPDGLTSPDIYFTPGYGRAASVTDGGEWVLLEAFDGAWQVPLILRTLYDGSKDAISPYGYSGVYASPTLTSSQVQDAWSATIDSMRELGVIAVVLRHSPLVPQAADLPGPRSIVSGHPTVVLEPVDSESAWSDMAGSSRTMTRKAVKHGYTGAVREATAEDLSPLGDFRILYEQTMTRLDAAARYFFDDAYYGGLLDGLGSDLLIAEVRDPAGAVVSVALLMRHAERLHYHLAGSTLDDMRMGANNLLLWTATQYAADHGLRQFHLGGGRVPGDDLFRFKRKFGGRELEYQVSGLIVEDESYQAHTEIRAKEIDTTTDDLSSADFFPAYRRGTTDV